MAPRAQSVARFEAGKGPRLREGPSNASRLFYQSEEFGAPFTLFVIVDRFV